MIVHSERVLTLCKELCGEIVQQFKNNFSHFTCPFASKTQFYEGYYYMGIVNKHRSMLHL